MKPCYDSPRTASITLAAMLLAINIATPQRADAEPPRAEASQDATFKIAELAWLAGRWTDVERESQRGTEEFWLAPRGGMMLGLNRSVGRSNKAAFEYLRIEQRKETVVYLASPAGRPPTAFTLQEAAKNRAVFVNSKNDFPSRIQYVRKGELLQVQIEGSLDGKKRMMSWEWTRRP